MDRDTMELKNVKITEGYSGYREDHEGQTRDDRELTRFGKKPQFARNFGWMSITGLTCTLMLTWEGSVVSFGPQLLNGGPAGAFGGFIFAWIGTIFQTLVMAELASAIPLSGGQYNWIAVMAPPRYSKFLSYLGGWVTLIAWQSAAASILFLCASMIELLASISHPDYVPLRWQVTLIMMALILFGLVVNTYLARFLTKFEALILILHIFGFFIVLICLVYLAPTKLPASQVFGEFVNGGMWPTNALSLMIGTVGSIFSFIGVDGAAHLAEEVKNASVVVPASMVATVCINGLTGLGMLIAMLFCIPNVENVIEYYGNGGLPFVQIFLAATGSSAGTIGLGVIPALVAICGGVGALATASRMVWAFAREDALPGSKYLARIHERSALPLNAILLTGVINLILALVEIGSTTAFNALAGLLIQGFYSVFLIAASVTLHKRLTTPEAKMHWGSFRLGKFGVPVTVVAIAYSLVGYFFSFWPPTTPTTVESFNWAVVVYVGVVIIAVCWWFIRARRYYTGPIREV